MPQVKSIPKSKSMQGSLLNNNSLANDLEQMALHEPKLLTSNDAYEVARKPNSSMMGARYLSVIFSRLLNIHTQLSFNLLHIYYVAVVRCFG